MFDVWYLLKCIYLLIRKFTGSQEPDGLITLAKSYTILQYYQFRFGFKNCILPRQQEDVAIRLYVLTETTICCL
ncbi:unnamed protein product [Allacma fusca]|uniref:Uncharacterized protein n=1 Tax=Allacma fusca TaxID=39272 RepID=A0A8J2Q300_9HEXA|nr:unnamed protein product [Allacma fusca]